MSKEQFGQSPKKENKAKKSASKTYQSDLEAKHAPGTGQLVCTIPIDLSPFESNLIPLSVETNPLGIKIANDIQGGGICIFETVYEDGITKTS